MSEPIRTREWDAKPHWVMEDKEYTYDAILGIYSEDSQDLVPQLVRRCQQFEAEIERLKRENTELREQVAWLDNPTYQSVPGKKRGEG